MEELLLADNRVLETYAQNFEWDAAKYNVKLSIRDIAQGISKVWAERPFPPCRLLGNTTQPCLSRSPST